MQKPALYWQSDHAMRFGDRGNGVKLQQGQSAVCTLAHSGCAWIEWPAVNSQVHYAAFIAATSTSVITAVCAANRDTTMQRQG
jgi:hypothetical protein